MRMAVRAGRSLLLLVLVMAGTMLLMRLAPGYFSDAAEMSAQRGGEARARMEGEAQQSWLHEDFGVSRQYDLPVWTLFKPRLWTSASLLGCSVMLGWLVAFGAALVRRLNRGLPSGLLALPFTLLLAVPVGAMATVCLLLESGGPILVLTLVVAARDFKFLDQMLAAAMDAPSLAQARAQGVRTSRMVQAYVLPAVAPQMVTLAVMSIVTALSALVPVEVLFDRPGIGQLAWNAAMNRDLPVLLAVTMTMAALVALLSAVSDDQPTLELS